MVTDFLDFTIRSSFEWMPGSPLIYDKFTSIYSVTISIELQIPIKLGLRENECLQFPLEH
jgi:hypothetical protein